MCSNKRKIPMYVNMGPDKSIRPIDTDYTVWVLLTRGFYVIMLHVPVITAVIRQSLYKDVRRRVNIEDEKC
jgi:hypothetical protein